ncbi:Cell division protein FtsI [Labilithrix luteola]|uniref:Cell division protein FtsI n=1 Tax=Labilithrix luteola TaxID=1391654 RepID=A0A0K1Q0W8_9BACT|nr:penicillin-binding transpeptidase domain-containing protein [Labilithrix luteola]AKU99266.1 Cell division protein FtsI [Labilithrix luteola]
MLRALWAIAAFWMVLLVARRSGAEVPSIDERLQASAERWLRTAAPHEGAVVMSDVKTGRVLAWASLGGGDRVGAAFAPLASVFKLATVAAMLDSGRATGGSMVCYSGGERAIDSSDLRDVHLPGEACIPLRTAVGYSINVAIAKLALRHTQPAEVEEKARLLGLDGVVPIDRAVGRSHITIPDDPLGFARAAAGFWNGRTSALGALFAVQTIANGGTRVRLHTGTKSPARVEEGRAMRWESAAELARMMQITTRSGTAAKAFHKGQRPSLEGVAVAGKTGTLIGDKPTRMYSWFVGFAPADAPEVAISVLLANDVTWRMKGNEVGREVLADYFRTRAAGPRRIARR